MKCKINVYELEKSLGKTGAGKFELLSQNTNWRRLSTADLLIKVASFLKKVNNIFSIKRS